MTRDELLKRVDAFCCQRGWPLVSPRMLRTWQTSCLLPSPERSSSGYKQGVDRDWPPGSYRRVLRICRLKHLGITRNNGLLFALWLRGAQAPFEKLKHAFAQEFVQLRKHLKPYALDRLNLEKPLTGRSQRAFLKAVGKSALVDYPPPVLRDAAMAMMQGAAKHDAIPKAMDCVVAYLQAQMPRDLPQEVAAEIRHDSEALSGMLADPKHDADSPGKGWIESADAENFDKARGLLRLIRGLDVIGNFPQSPEMKLFLPIRELPLNVLRDLRWELPIFAVSLCAVLHNKTKPSRVVHATFNS